MMDDVNFFYEGNSVLQVIWCVTLFVNVKPLHSLLLQNMEFYLNNGNIICTVAGPKPTQ